MVLIDMVLIDVDLLQYHQEKPMDIKSDPSPLHYLAFNAINITLPCIQCRIDMILLSAWLLPMTMAKFLSGQAQVLALCL